MDGLAGRPLLEVRGRRRCKHTQFTYRETSFLQQFVGYFCLLFRNSNIQIMFPGNRSPKHKDVEINAVSKLKYRQRFSQEA